MASFKNEHVIDLSNQESEINVDPTMQTNTIELAEPPQVVKDALRHLKLGVNKSTRSVQIDTGKNVSVFRELPLKNQILQKLRDGLPNFEVFYSN